MRRTLLPLALLLAACPDPAVPPVEDAGSTGGGGGGQSDAGPLGQRCDECLVSSECVEGACAQIGGDSHCAKRCSGASQCAATDDCLFVTTAEGTQAQVCVPRNGGCQPDGGGGCGVCPAGTACEPSSGTCIATTPDAGAPDGGACGTKLPPATPSCCKSCTQGAAGCQPNGCYGGWYCDVATQPQCYCRPPPTSCSAPDGGGFDAGGAYDGGPITGTVGPDGGVVSRLFFAVVGDTRPGQPDDTAS